MGEKVLEKKEKMQKKNKITDAGDYINARENIEAQLRSSAILTEFNKVLLKYVEKKLKKMELPKSDVQSGK